MLYYCIQLCNQYQIYHYNQKHWLCLYVVLLHLRTWLCSDHLLCLVPVVSPMFVLLLLLHVPDNCPTLASHWSLQASARS